MRTILFKIAGYSAVALGFAGIFLPVLPTTPFLLLAVWCFSRSDPRLNRWLMENRFFGRYLQNYRKGKGIPPSVKFAILVMLWGTISFSAIVLTYSVWVTLLLFGVSLFVSIHVLNQKTARCEE